MSLDTLAVEDREPVLDFLVGLGDDEYLHGDRLSSWLTVAPTLEEDNVLTSVAQDEMGHARLWFDLVCEYRDADVDALAIGRPAEARANSTLVEREFVDFADTVVRSFLYDRYELLLLEAMEDGSLDELIGRAGVALDEERFHREHVDEWLAVFRTLGRESDRRRLREAVRSNLAHASDLFSFPGPSRLVDCGAIAKPPSSLEAEWRSSVLPTLAALPIDLDESELSGVLDAGGPNGRAGRHTDHLDGLLESMRPTEIERLDA